VAGIPLSWHRFPLRRSRELLTISPLVRCHLKTDKAVNSVRDFSVNRFGLVPQAVPSVFGGTERDSNSANRVAAITYGFQKREYCYEEGRVRGARLLSTERIAKPVNARRREIGCRAFCVLGVIPQGFTTIPLATSRSLVRERILGVRKEPARFLPHPGISCQNSRTL